MSNGGTFKIVSLYWGLTGLGLVAEVRLTARLVDTQLSDVSLASVDNVSTPRPVECH